jgi:hypothetical protein
MIDARTNVCMHAHTHMPFSLLTQSQRDACLYLLRCTLRVSRILTSHLILVCDMHAHTHIAILTSHLIAARRVFVPAPLHAESVADP